VCKIQIYEKGTGKSQFPFQHFLTVEPWRTSRRIDVLNKFISPIVKPHFVTNHVTSVVRCSIQLMSLLRSACAVWDRRLRWTQLDHDDKRSEHRRSDNSSDYTDIPVIRTANITITP
jgi:hypothetical protein